MDAYFFLLTNGKCLLRIVSPSVDQGQRIKFVMRTNSRHNTITSHSLVPLRLQIIWNILRKFNHIPIATNSELRNN
ncbi:hypothetical protein ACH3XW_4725 [Acanthocheilonema viteae]